ncbi:MAG TPA: hypothetical protein VK641_14860 [Terriglobales bacterium]|nr:hypothetical protein [Terriglobales bacterium]
MSHQTDEFITCQSCDFRYPSSRGICVMCGAPGPTAAPVRAASEGVSQPHGSSRAPQVAISGEAPPPEVEAQGSGKSIWLGVAVSVVVLVPLLLVLQHWKSSPATEPPAVVMSARPRLNSELAAAPVRAAKHPAKKDHALAPEQQQAESTAAASEQDPAELWKDVRGGSARAEVTLARLYLDGNTVPQSCEQTHMLLLAASKKGSKAADSLLTGAYLQRCHPGLTE